MGEIGAMDAGHTDVALLDFISLDQLPVVERTVMHDQSHAASIADASNRVHKIEKAPADLAAGQGF